MKIWNHNNRNKYHKNVILNLLIRILYTFCMPWFENGHHYLYFFTISPYMFDGDKKEDLKSVGIVYTSILDNSKWRLLQIEIAFQGNVK